MIPVLFVLLTVVSTTAIPVSAKRPELLFVGCFGGGSIEHPGDDGSTFMVEAMVFCRTPVGKADFLMVSLMVDETEVPVAAITDNPDFAGLLDEMFGMPGWTTVVEDEELEVRRIGRRLYAESTVQAGMVPPLYAEIVGVKGGPTFMEESEVLPSGYSITLTGIVFEATATFVCHAWGCNYTSQGMVGPHFTLIATPPTG